MTTLHVLLKFPNISFPNGVEQTNTVYEHQRTYEVNNRLIWGQSSNKEISGISSKNRQKLLKQIEEEINTYTFFLANNGKGEKELYVGKMINVYDRGEIDSGSDLVNYVPSYYRNTIGTTNDRNNVFVDVTSFYKIDNTYIENMVVASSKNPIPFKGNSTPTFLINIDSELDHFLYEILNDAELSYQYQIEQMEEPEAPNINDIPKEKEDRTYRKGSKVFKRDPKTAKNAVAIAAYVCEIDNSHESFISRTTKKNYVEAHHLIPIEKQDEFEKSIDVEANIVSLCVNCHKKLHHAELNTIKPLIEDLYTARIQRLIDCGIELTMEQLISYYK